MSDKLYRCQKCESENLGNDWNKTTAELCKTNDIVPIGEANLGEFFHCPTCKESSDYPDILHIKVVDCEYCEGDVNDREYLFIIEDSYYECNIYIDGNGNLTDDTFNKKINYCPICSRKLGE